MQTLKLALAVAGVALSTQAAAQITLYEGEGFRGAAFTADKPIWDFDPYGFNDRARSVVVNGGKDDQFVHEVMEEIGIDMSVHTPHILDELVANRFDLVITLSDDAPEAVSRKGLEAGAVEHWSVSDPSLVEGNRELVLGAYRDLRDSLRKRVRDRLEPLISGGSQIH